MIRIDRSVKIYIPNVDLESAIKDFDIINNKTKSKPISAVIISPIAYY
ncbi:MAG: hypothetical protein IPK06_14590 [Ignavibacteriae bacterium]|nr:hypothetical protein [Ignavibacteriota bacterium]